MFEIFNTKNSYKKKKPKKIGPKNFIKYIHFLRTAPKNFYKQLTV